jgi:hypothetical protein
VAVTSSEINCRNAEFLWSIVFFYKGTTQTFTCFMQLCKLECCALPLKIFTKMGYYLQAFIGQTSVLEKFKLQYSSSKLIELINSISMIPLTEELFYQINEKEEPEWISPGENNFELIESKILKVITGSKVAYVEAEYFGGQGWQMAVIWENSKRISEPEFGDNKINEVLRNFGVKPFTGKDEFETAGLRRQRNTRDW